MLVAFGFAACTTESTDSGNDPPPLGPDPWEDLDTPLDPFRELLSVDAGTVPGGRLAAVAGIPALAAWPRASGGAALLDSRYRLAADYSCLDASVFPDADDGAERQGRCEAGRVELDRTHLGLAEPVVDMADDPVGHQLSVLLEGGRVRVANTDLLVGNPWDWLRLGPEITLASAEGAEPTAIVPRAAGGWWGVAGAELVTWSADGSRISALALEGEARVLAASGDHVWAATATQLTRDDGLSLAAEEPRGLVGDGIGGAWVATQNDENVWHVATSGSVDATGGVAGLTGPIAYDARTAKVYVLVSDGVAVVLGGAEVGRYPAPAPAAVVVNDSSEISVLGANGVVHVFVDETALGEAPPLDAWIATFVENPRQEAAEVACSGADDAMEERAARATDNRAFLRDVPATVALAVSTAASAHAKRCKVDDELAALFDGVRIEPGVLFHDPPACTDQDCLDSAMQGDLAELTKLGIDPAWISGAAGWETGSGDWVKALISLDMPARHGFVGLSALPDIGMDDPRAKDPLPWAGEAEAAPTRASSAATVGVDTPGGELLLLPGNTQAVFNLGGCAGVLQAECRILGLGGGETVDADDLAVADLLLHRAAVHRSESGGDTWYFHLPAIEVYAYADGCEEQDRVWTGAGCQAAALQTWLFDVQARLVNGGAVRWGTPSAVAGG